MSDIIYTSNSIIPWDTQSAFKIENYNVTKEEHMIFCYLKTYVYKEDLRICSFCFNKNPAKSKSLELSLNLNPLYKNSFLHIEYGFYKIYSAKIILENDIIDIDTNFISFSTFTGDDEQGHYWAFDINISKEFIKEYFFTTLAENSLISFNLHQVYDNSYDFSSLVKTKENSYKEKMHNQKQVLIFNY